MDLVASRRHRFMSKIRKSASGHWMWTGGYTALGYGLFKWDWRQSGMCTAQRAAWRLFRGAVRKGWDVDHLCRRRGCVNPNHLQHVSHRTNVLRSRGVTAHNAQKKRCKRGHRFDLLLDGKRRCRRCMNLNKKQARDRRRMPMVCEWCTGRFQGLVTHRFCSSSCRARAMHHQQGHQVSL
jgi:HNH endonuclease